MPMLVLLLSCFALGQPDATQNPPALSQVFPVFAVNMNFDLSQVDGTDVPSRSASFSNSGVNDSFQREWDALKAGGFNAVTFQVDLNDPQAATRVANLCIWAKANSVFLIPVLTNVTTASAAAKFPSALVSRLRSGLGQQQFSGFYAQIAYFQVEGPMNVGSLHPNMNAADAQKTLLGAVDALRNAEVQALAGTGSQPTAIMVSVSFDYELIQQGAIVGVTLDPAAEQRAQAALKQFLLPFAGAANIDAVRVMWFPRSITSGDESHFAGLLRDLETALPGKGLVLETGFSTAFNAADQQSQFMTLALTSMASFRASDGADSRFLGVMISQAFQDPNANVSTPAGSSDPTRWNWNTKAQQLAQMWSQGKKSADLTWWLAKVRSNTALLATDLAPTPGLQAIQQFSTTVAQVSQDMSPPAPAQPTPDAGDQAPSAPPTAPSDSPQAGSGSPSTAQQMLLDLVQQVATQLTGALGTKLTTSSPAQTPASSAATNNDTNPPSLQPTPAPDVAPTQPSTTGIWLAPQDVTVDAATAVPGQPVHITAELHNSNPNQDFSALTVQLIGVANPASSGQASQSRVAVPRLGTTSVQLTWTAVQPAGVQSALSVQVLDSNGSLLASAAVPSITVTAAGAGPNPNPTSTVAAAPRPLPTRPLQLPTQSLTPPNTNGTSSNGVVTVPPRPLPTRPLQLPTQSLTPPNNNGTSSNGVVTVPPRPLLTRPPQLPGPSSAPPNNSRPGSNGVVTVTPRPLSGPPPAPLGQGQVPRSNNASPNPAHTVKPQPTYVAPQRPAIANSPGPMTSPRRTRGA
jgi:hypothetical protein